MKGFLNFDYVGEWVDGFSYSIVQESDGWVLRWSDGVANNFRESFSLLSHCVARLACLIACAESNYEVGFNHNSEGFESIADDFFRVAVG